MTALGQSVPSVADLLAAGCTPRELARARQQLGAEATPAEVTSHLARTLGVHGQGRLDLDSPAVDGSVPPEGLVTTLHVLGGDHPLPDRLAQTWGCGGPLWVWRRATAVAWPGSPRAVGIVGTRRPTLDGLQLARRIAADLAAAGVEVVSGMARGIDQAAHRGALAGGGRTTGVLGTGLDVDYPAGAGPLRRQVAGSGGLVTEYPHRYGVRHRSQFPSRNRILAGLVDGVVVIEAGNRSGALNTAGWAADLGRDVMVVPASPNNAAAGGGLALLRDGAVPVTSAADVLSVLGHDDGRPDRAPDREGSGDHEPHAIPPDPRAARLSAAARGILPLLGPQPAEVGALARAAGVGARDALVAVSELEECALARRTSGGIVAAPPGTPIPA